MFSSRSFASTWRRSADRPAAPAAPSPSASLYRTFGRPFSKVFLGALFTYQLAYWTWAKLETDEEIADKRSRRKNQSANQILAVE